MKGLGGVFFRPKPLGVSVGIPAEGASYSIGQGQFVGNQAVYENISVMWPGIWQVQIVGGGGGGGGYDTFYQRTGERGGTAVAVTVMAAVTGKPLARIGRNGGQGTSSSSGGGNGTAGGNSQILRDTGTTITASAGGAAGRGGQQNTNYSRIPVASTWPYIGGAGQGGYGRDGSADIFAIQGSIRMTLKG